MSNPKIERYERERALKKKLFYRLNESGCPDRAASRILGVSHTFCRRWREEKGLAVSPGVFEYFKGGDTRWEDENFQLVISIMKELDRMD